MLAVWRRWHCVNELRLLLVYQCIRCNSSPGSSSASSSQSSITRLPDVVPAAFKPDSFHFPDLNPPHNFQVAPPVILVSLLVLLNWQIFVVKHIICLNSLCSVVPAVGSPECSSWSSISSCSSSKCSGSSRGSSYGSGSSSYRGRSSGGWNGGQ